MALFSLKRIAGEAENRQPNLRRHHCTHHAKDGRLVRDRDDLNQE